MKRVLAVVAGAIVALGCPDPVAQCKATCNGCCTAQGTCEAGTSKAACGELGATCAVCEIEEICNPTRCTARPVDAGTDAGADDGGVDAGPPGAFYTLNPTTPMFLACATRDLAGAPLADVFPDVQLLTVQNVGSLAGTPAFALTGAGASAFSVDGGSAVLAPDAGTTVEVRFAPSDAGLWVASLTAGNATATLTGTVHPNPPQPLLQVAVIGGDGTFTPCPAGLVCEQQFPDTLFNDAVSREVRLTNLGCPSLKITGAEILPLTGATGELAFRLEAPAIAPTADVPIVLTLSQANQATKLKVRFAPTDDGTGSPTRFATLRLKTNDRTVTDGNGTPGGFDVLLSANALAPAILTTPTHCAFSDPADLCGNATKQANKANFTVTNDGNVAIKIDSTVFQNNTAGRFSITTPIAGMVIGPANSVPLEITHTALPLFVQDQLVLSASIPGQDAGTAGRALIAVSGGVPPCLSTVPTTLDFGNPTAATTTKIVTIRNGMGCGVLTINSLKIDPNPYFTLFPPLLQPGMAINPGVNVDATVKYTRPVSGGVQAGVLRVDSNDPVYPQPSGLTVPLYSQAPIDQLPVAVIKACAPADTACATPFTTVSLASLPVGANGTRLVTVFGNDSYDPPGMTTKATKFRFNLIGFPAGATTQSLMGGGVKATASKVTLALDGTATGLYRVTLDVWDAGDQKCAASALLNLNVTP